MLATPSVTRHASSSRKVPTRKNTCWKRDICPDAIRQPVGFFARHRHFLDHIMPVALAMAELGIPMAGVWVSNKALRTYAEGKGWGVKTSHPLGYSEGKSRKSTLRKYLEHPTVPPLDFNPIGVASLGCYLQIRENIFRPIIALEHGCGLSYIGDLPSERWTSLHISRMCYKHFGNAINLRLVPNEFQANREKKSYPSLPTRVIGDSPKMDKWRGRNFPKPGGKPVVCLSTHFDLTRTPETRETLSLYAPSIASLVKGGYHVIGHSHPRIWDKAKTVFEDAGVEPVMDFDEVLERADVYCTSGSSTIYEFASVGKPVVCLRAPFMRKGINHGLLFWDAVPGVECWQPSNLCKAVDTALEDSDEIKSKRAFAISQVYPNPNGKSAQRAAEAIQEWQLSLKT